MQAYIYVDNNHGPDIDSIAETPDQVRYKYLKECMGWRFEHPDRYNQDEAWWELLKYGKIAIVKITIIK